MKTVKELFYEHHMEVGSEVSRVLQKVCVEYIEGILEDCVNVDTLPEVIKQQANAFQQTHCSCEPSVAWLEGFGYCLAGKVHVARFAAAKTLKHCQIENKYKELSNSVRELLDCAENCTKKEIDNRLAMARQFARVQGCLDPTEPEEVEDDWVVPDKEPL